MATFLESAFWLLLLLTAYSYFLYPLLLACFARTVVATPAARETRLPSMTLIVTAFNEAKRIRAKIENTLAIDYPGLEIIVASDCSEDDTDAIVRSFADRNVRLVRARERLGKENAQKCAIEAAGGEILVFSDVATTIPPDALQRLATYFHDASIGAVSSEDRFIAENGRVAGEGAYVRYEMWLRKMESKRAGLVGLSGSFFAARATVCTTWDIHSPSDFNTALNSARLGMHAVSAPDVLGFYKDLQDPSKEYQRKVRTVLRGITAMARHADVLNPLRFGMFSWQMWSHKIMRWAVPWLLVLLLAVNVPLAVAKPFYQLALAGQLLFHGVAIAAHYFPRLRSVGFARIIYYFVQVNVAIADATIRFLAGKRMTVWNPSSR